MKVLIIKEGYGQYDDYREEVLETYLSNENFDGAALMTELGGLKGISREAFFKSKGFFKIDFEDVLI